MSAKTVFVKPKDLTFIENMNELILRKGFLHINEIIIDKHGSSNEFIKTMKQFWKEGKIELDEHEEVYNDFLKLLKFGFIAINSNKSFIILTNKSYINQIQQLTKESICVKDIETIVSVDEQKIIREDKNIEKIDEIKEKFKKNTEGYDHIYVVEDFCNLTTLRSINRLTYMIEIESTISFIDNDNIYLTAIKPNYTGCFECLENHILSKFPGVISDYEEKYVSEQKCSCGGNLLIILGWIFKDIENIEKYGMSSLTGNVIHMYTPNFEYSYNANMKSSACVVCAGINHVKFEEQNIRSVNVIKEAFEDD